MATPHENLQLAGLPLRLVRDGLTTEAKITELRNKASKNKQSFFTVASQSKELNLPALIRCASEEFGMPLFNIESLDPDNSAAKLVSEGLIERHRILPLYKRGSKLFVAIADPTKSHALDEIKFHTGLGIEPILVNPLLLEKVIDQTLELNDTAIADLSDEEGLEDIDISAEDDGDKAGETDIDQIDTPIVRFVNKMLLDAIKKGASDIHMEPYEKKLRVRFRVDGVLHEVASTPVNLAGRIVARVKILSRLDIAERRVPQDGRMKLNMSKNRSINFRVSTLPTIYGEKVVIRLLDGGTTLLGLDKLGMDEDQKEHYLDAISRPYGMILVTGPTGSGKTVTLYTALDMLNQIERNISTVEDPVEIHMAGINQVNINEKADLLFAKVLRSLLRQDPDVIMVGEIRDLETADIAVKASQTGHLVLSTVHTNDAPSTLTRLLNMGVAPFNVASSVHLIMAQRLVRKLCDNCKTPAIVPEKALLKAGFTKNQIEGLQLYSAAGCDGCTGGYRGREAVFQVMPISDDTANLIMNGGTQHDIEQQAIKEGVRTLRQSGLAKVQAGITSLEEIERVTNL